MENKNPLDRLSNGIKNFIIVLLLLLLIGTGAILVLKPASISVEQYNELVDTLHSERNSKGEQISTIKALQFENASQFTKLRTQDSTIKWLQTVVRDFKGTISSAIIAASNTSSNGTTVTNITNISDTVRKGNALYVYPTYKTDWNTKWETGEIIANKDSIHRKIKVRNEYEFTTGLNDSGFLKKVGLKRSEFVVKLKNNNPNTETVELREFTLKPKIKKLGLGFSAGITLGSNLKPSPYLGVGLSYNVIEIW